MTTHINGKAFKEFRAVCQATGCSLPGSARTPRRTTQAPLREAAKRLDIRAVQVDGN